jgi:hypothetical protein
MHCATQVMLEATSLIHYGEAWADVRELLRRLESLIAVPDPSPLTQADDGSWGGCTQSFYHKLEPTVDALQTRTIREKPIKPLTFLQSLTDPQVLLSRLYALQITDIAATGHNYRDELGAMLAGMSQLIFKDEIRSLLADPSLGFVISDRLDEVYRDFVRQTQHPRTGYWGPWYRFDDRLIMVQDLSFTFHHINYLSGNLDHWQAIIDTTLAIRELRYPMGWKPADSAFNNHNNYDVIQIFAYGWPQMRRDQKDAARLAISDMLKWCLAESVVGDGFGAGQTSVDDYYYGVRFLDRAGFWDPAKCFWTSGSAAFPNTPNPRDLAERFQRGFEKVRDDSVESETVQDIIDRALRLSPTVGSLLS